ncbi:phasin [Methylobacterium sp. E-065]|uniref:phasin n=1 Tax=Methylobacterium sp. E-065 TaxID=2836583 RepID=UPI001FBA2F1F|nr:phasin [Methylobacterium sp. E-065]MCJ2019821.1 phasin [Methylobacterium sp. E-065]
MANIPNLEVPPQMRDLAENSVTQARTAFASYMDSAKRNAEMMKGSAEQTGANLQGLYTRALAYAEENVQAGFDHAQKLARAGTMQEAIQLQMEFARGQFAAMQTQAKEFGGMVQGAMKEGAEKAKTAMQEGAAHTHKALEQGQDAAKQATHEAGQAVDQATH